jgi:hypothetical protein
MNAASNKQLTLGNSVRRLPLQNMKLEWKSILVTGLIAIVAMMIYNAFLRPIVAQLPIVGKYA